MKVRIIGKRQCGHVKLGWSGKGTVGVAVVGVTVGEPLATVGAKDGDGDGASVVGKSDG